MFATFALWGALFVTPTQDDSEKPYDVAHMIREWKSSNELCRRVARKALRAFGGVALDPLCNAGETELAEEILYPDPDSREILRRIQTRKVTATFAQVPLENAIELLVDLAGVNLVMDDDVPGDRAAALISAKLSDVSLEKALRTILSPLDLSFVPTQSSAVLISTREKCSSPSQSFVPLRTPVSPAQRESARQRVAKLDEEIEKRDAAANELRGMGFVAEQELWRGLKNPSEGVRTACVELLEVLYARGGRPHPTPNPFRERLKTKQVTVRVLEVPLPALLDHLSDALEVPVVLDPKIERPPVSLEVTDISAESALQLVLTAKKLAYCFVGEAIFVTTYDRLPIRTRLLSQQTVWLPPSEAARVEAILSGAKGDLRPEDVPLLRWAQTRVDSEWAAKYETAIQNVIAESSVWFSDEPSGLAKQGGELLRKLERTRVDLHFEDASWEEVFGFLGESAGVKFQSPPREGTLRLHLKGARLVDVLDLLTKPYGLDYAEKGGAIEMR